jgi:hypothetical protein
MTLTLRTTRSLLGARSIISQAARYLPVAFFSSLCRARSNREPVSGMEASPETVREWLLRTRDCPKEQRI